jgi:hypothetical protein
MTEDTSNADALIPNEEHISGHCQELVVYFVTGAASGILLDVDLDAYHIEREIKTMHPVKQWLEEGYVQEKDLREWIRQAVSARITDPWALAEEVRRDHKTISIKLRVIRAPSPSHPARAEQY